MKKTSLNQIFGGGLQEQFDKAFDRVVQNLADPNTSFKEARKIIIELKFTQNEARDDVSCTMDVKEKLAAQAPMQTAFAVGKNLKTGEMYVEEYGRYAPIKGQIAFEGVTVDSETGEVLEEPESTATVVDFRRAATN